MKYLDFCEGGRALRMAFGTLIFVGLLLISTSMAQISPSPGSGGSSGGSGGINGSIAYGPMTWNASNFPGFWHEDSVSSEILAVLQSDLSSSQRVIDKANLVYATTAQPIMLKVVSSGLDMNASTWDYSIAASQGLEQAGTGQAFDGGNYYVVGWQGQKYVALNGKVDKLTSLVLEQNSTDYKILAVNESWSMGNNYTLELKSIDAKAFPYQALLELANESGKVDEKVIQEGQVYTYVANSIAGESNVPLFVTYVDNMTENSVRLKYTWMISTSVKQITSGDTYGLFKVAAVYGKTLELRNSDVSITLSPGSTILLMDGLYLVANDSPSLEYYPMMTMESPPTPVFSVRNLNTGENFSTIQDAIDNASAGDTILVYSGTYFENIVVDKSLTIQGENRDTTIIHAFNSDKPVFKVSADYVNISGFKAEGATNFGLASGGIAGIQLYRGSDYCNISNNNVTNNSFGIFLWESKNNNVSNNIANLNLFDGINLYYFSNDNILSNNIAESNNEHGIYLTVNIYNNILSGNIAGSNKYSGIAFSYSDGNTLYDNIVSNNRDGISMSVSSGNTIYNNYFNNTNNFLSGINIMGSNTWNTTKTRGMNIISGPYLGGNVWAHPNGSGFSQTCSDSDNDGICDSFYTLDSNNIDYLPLAVPAVPPSGAPYITSFSPLTSTMMDNVGVTRTFNIIINQTVNVSWQINGTEVFNETGVTTSSYTNTSATLGTWNVTAIASNTNGAALQSWVWIVTPVPTAGIISGFKINDTNGNGKWDAGEKGISNWTIRLIGITGKGKDTRIIRKETFTDAMGFYQFDNLQAGRYFVIEKLKKGFIPTGSPVKRIKLAQNEISMNNNFTNKPIHSPTKIGSPRDQDDYEIINRNIDKYIEDMD